MKEALSTAQEAEAQLLAQRISQAAQEELLQIARTLVGSNTSTLFGANEFKIRDLILRVAAKAYQEHLAEKKRLRGLQHHLPKVRPRRPLSWRSITLPAEPARTHPLPPRLLLLPPLR